MLLSTTIVRRAIRPSAYGGREYSPASRSHAKRPITADTNAGSARHDPALHDLSRLRQHAQLTLAFVQIKPYRIHGGWSPLRLYDRVQRLWGDSATHVQWMASRFIPTKRIPLATVLNR